jgi:capsid protein
MTSPNYETMTMRTLRHIAAAQGISYLAALKKADLIKMLRQMDKKAKGSKT